MLKLYTSAYLPVSDDAFLVQNGDAILYKVGWDTQLPADVSRLC